MIRKGVRKIFSFLGFNLVRKEKEKKLTNLINKEITPLPDFDYGKEGSEVIKITKEYSMLPPVNLQTLFEQAIYCEKENIPGSFVECGVWKGGAVATMAGANLQFGINRRYLHLFDTFDNIGPPDAKVDGQKAIDDAKNILGFLNEKNMQGQLESVSGGYDTMGGAGSIEICKELLEYKIKYPAEFIHYHKGWFQHTLPEAKNGIDQIAILRLDGDWYNSIKVCLENLYEKVVHGGVVIIDDYGYYEGCTKAVDEFLAIKEIKTFLSYSTPGSRFFIKCQH